MLQIYKKKHNITNLFIKKFFSYLSTSKCKTFECFALRLLRVGN